MNVEMPEAEWVKVLNILADQKFKDVAMLIQQIQSQLSAQAQAAQQQNIPRPNGSGEVTRVAQ
jgi:hypothetical protein